LEKKFDERRAEMKEFTREKHVRKEERSINSKSILNEIHEKEISNT